ncbi:MAG: YfiR family protein [Methylococcaceae bacterium]
MRAVITSMLTAVIICCTLNSAEAAESSELIRASIIEKISRFIEWPVWTGERFTLCVADKAPLLPALQTYYANTSLANKPVSLLTFRGVHELKDCQVIYLSDDQSDDLETILQSVRNQPILIVTEKKDDVSQGAHVDFFVEDNRLHLEVNRTALLNSGLKASYHLLKVARIVE